MTLLDDDSQPVSDLRELKGLLPDELEDIALDIGLERYRGRQIAQWIFGYGVQSFDMMTNLSKKHRQMLSDRATILSLHEAEVAEDPSGQATKFLFEMRDGRRVESVLMTEGKRRTLCVSSQVGCPLDCTFCATGKMGLIRNLTAGEIVDQVVTARRHLSAAGEDLTNVVLMGMGEPMLNLPAVTRAIQIINLDYGPAVSRRRITLSTAGHVPGIEQMAQNGPRVMLAVSLNATTDALRDEIMPINKRWPIAVLLEAVKAYQRSFGRYITFEYVLLSGVNDTVDDARALVNLVREIPCKTSGIPWNPIDGERFGRPPESRIQAFVETIAAAQMTVTVRYSKGTDIAAGCGQLYQTAPGAGVA